MDKWVNGGMSQRMEELIYRRDNKLANQFKAKSRHERFDRRLSKEMVMLTDGQNNRLVSK